MSIITAQPRTPRHALSGRAAVNAPKVGKESEKKKDNKRREERRINTLVEMDERHKNYLETRNKQGLIELAGEYAALNCPHIANKIITESESMDG